MKKILACIVVLAGCAALSAPVAAQAADAALKKEVIRFGVGLDPAFSPVYYAAQNKMFEQAGLNVELLLLAQAADALDAVIAGQNQLGGGSESTVITRAARGDVRAFAIFGESAKFIKLAARKGITKPEEIKKFGVVPGSAGEFVSGKLLAKYGIAPDSITWVKGAPPEFPALLARGDVDAYFLWEPWPTRALSVGGTILMESGDVGYSYNMLVASSGAWLRENQAEARALAKVLGEACAQIRADPEKAAVATQAATKIPLEQARTLLKDVTCSVRDFTPEDMATYNEIADFQFKGGLVPKRADVTATMQTGYVESAR